MKKSDLRKIISEIVQKKLNEASGKQIADSINKIYEEEGYLEDVRISTFYGSEPLKIMEIWMEGRTLHMNVDTPSPNSLTELETQQNAAGAEQTALNQNAAKADPTLAAKQKQLADETKKLDDLTNVVKKADANMSKREQTLKQANMKDQRVKDTATRKQGPIISKINSIKKDIENKSNSS